MQDSPNTFCKTQLEQDLEVALARRYGDEIKCLLAELWATLPDYRKGTVEKTYRLVRENLEVLTNCFYTNALSVQALGVLRDHLGMLSCTFAYRTAAATRHYQLN